MSSVRTRLLHERLGDVAADDAMGQALGDRRLADARLADQSRVVLGAAGQDLDDPLDLLLAADDRVELAQPGGLGQVDAELVDRGRLAGALGLLGRTGRGRLRQDADDLVADLVQADAERLEDAGGDPLALADQTQEQVLRADVVVAETAGLVDGQLDDALGARRQPDLADDRPIAPADDELDGRPDLGQLDVHVLEHARGDTLALAHEAEEQVLGADVVVVEPLRLVLSQRQDLASAVRELVETIHQRERLFCRVAGERPLGHASTARRPCNSPQPGRSNRLETRSAAAGRLPGRRSQPKIRLGPLGSPVGRAGPERSRPAGGGRRVDGYVAILLIRSRSVSGSPGPPSGTDRATRQDSRWSRSQRSPGPQERALPREQRLPAEPPLGRPRRPASPQPGLRNSPRLRDSPRTWGPWRGTPLAWQARGLRQPVPRQRPRLSRAPRLRPQAARFRQ